MWRPWLSRLVTHDEIVRATAQAGRGASVRLALLIARGSPLTGQRLTAATDRYSFQIG
jgi:hypothetical protein